jgi:hypothetical protein
MKSDHIKRLDLKKDVSYFIFITGWKELEYSFSKLTADSKLGVGPWGSRDRISWDRNYYFPILIRRSKRPWWPFGD